MQKRAVDRAAIARFRLGYAPGSGRRCARPWRAGAGAADMSAAGMLVAGDDIPFPTIASAIA